ncbi:hypothetical protein, partial [Escherichia coli]|uniref:hypothetical protein n=1 Tax=Escherichia coli TaxID=562 RepID=UPI002B23F3B4
ACFGAMNGRFDGCYGRIDLLLWFCILLLVVDVTRVAAWSRGFGGVYTRLNLFFWLCISLLLFQLACFGAGNSRFNGSFTWISNCGSPKSDAADEGLGVGLGGRRSIHDNILPHIHMFCCLAHNSRRFLLTTS